MFKENYFEIHLHCPLRVLVRRDTKSLYAKAKKNLIKNLIGFNSSIKYENSSHKKLVVYTDVETIKMSANKIFKKLNINGKV